jgi:hypothetical protein
MPDIKLADGDYANYAQAGPSHLSPRRRKDDRIAPWPQGREKPGNYQPAANGCGVPDQQRIMVSNRQW